MSTGQDPTHVIAHSLGFLPGKNRVMCLVHGGKSIPWNVTLRGEQEWEWDRQEGLPFLSKRASPPEAVGRSEVRCTQCPLSVAHKTHSWCCNSTQKPLGQWWKKWLCSKPHSSSYTHSAKTQMHVSRSKVINNVWVFHLDKRCDTSQQQMSNVYSVMWN